MSAAGSGAGSGSQMRQGSSDSFSTWPHRSGSDGRHHSGMPPSVRFTVMKMERAQVHVAGFLF
jgi:hypothetical protein